MKVFLLRCLSVTIILFVLSCERPAADVRPGLAKTLAQTALTSDQFKNLELDVSRFSLSDAQFTTRDQKSIYIPTIGLDNQSGLAAIFNDDQSLKKIMFFDVDTNSEGENIEADLKKGKFDGTFLFQFEEGSVHFDVEKSQILHKKIRKTKFAEKCAYWASEGPGGAFDCAGRRLTEMDLLQKLDCYWSFWPCMALNVLSCAWDGCPKE